MIDTHAHIYSEEFDADRVEMLQRAKEAGVRKIVLPNIDRSSLQRMLDLEAAEPGYCYAAIGVHPTSIREDYAEELDMVKQELARRKYIAIGEIGIDLYWDKTFLKEQIAAFRKQLDWSLDYDLPVIIHVRDSFRETMEVLLDYRDKGLKGVFHSFTGNKEEALAVIATGSFLLGINGIVTFKNSGLRNVIHEIGIDKLILETDAPYLSPVPFRGKRNESAYLKLVAEKIAEANGQSCEFVIKQTSNNAMSLFNFGSEV